MQKTGIANLPLHYGNAPRWLFKRMVGLGSEITRAIIFEYGQEEFIKRMSNPYFFQSLGCVLGFDWHSSGLTTTLCGALKEAINNNTEELGIYIAGGKGKASKKAPEQIKKAADCFNISTHKAERLIYASKMSAKVDNSLVQDNYQLYHHCFFLTENGKWAVVQQGLNENIGYARRYHWHYENIENNNNFIEEPHSAICSEKKEKDVLDMTAKESKEVREISLDIVNEGNFERYFNDIKQKTLFDFENKTHKPIKLWMQRKHNIKDACRINFKTLQKAYEIQPKDYEELVAIEGVGPKTIRSLALIADIIYGKKASWKDPAKFSFAHGGKDGVPYPVDRELYDKSIEILKNAVKNAKIGEKERLWAIKRLADIINIM
ncbi:MAG: DUF763 domain-containing protein [Candidatus Woesearchaeota archaeon]|nr:DUF763 domain-containing protein [Candidatus Woesearchaeota archaeon]